MSSAGVGGRAARPGPLEFALLAGISLAWGTSYMFTKISVAVVPPLSLIAARTTLASLGLVCVMAALRRGPRLTARDLAAFALVGLISNAAPLSLIALSVSHVHSSVTATTMALVPLITALYGGFRGEFPRLRNLIGIAVGFAGIVVLFGPGALMAFGDSARGALAAIAAALIFSASLYSIALVRHFEPIVVTTISLVSAALWSLPVALFVEGVPAALPDAPVLAAIVVLAVFNTAGANLMLFALVPRAGATFTSYNNYLVPTVAVICGTLFLGEPFTAGSAAGVLLVLAGVAISTIQFKAKRLGKAKSSGG